MLETKPTLFDGPAGEDHAQVWLEPAGAGVILKTQEWGSGVEQNFGFDTVETALTIGGPELSTLAYALVADDPELDLTASPIELLATAYRGDSAASANVRRRLEELGLAYEFAMQ